MEKNKAFTIIELLIVVSIILLFVGTVLAQYNNFAEQSKLKNEGKKLVDVLELAKKKALSSELTGSCDNFTGYKVTLSTSAYSLNFCCASICSLVQNYDLTTNNTITSTTGDFNLPPLMMNPHFSITEINLKNSFINKCVSISISPVGIFELDETLIDC